MLFLCGSISSSLQEELRSNSTKQSRAKILRLPRSLQSLAMTA
ncbi:hypothetical protein [Rickettsia hoogstraalii]|nr:hypothetical protein [Rickettsia hoogstraalii]